MATLTAEFPKLTDEVLEAVERRITVEEKERPACFSLMSPDVFDAGPTRSVTLIHCGWTTTTHAQLAGARSLFHDVPETAVRKHLQSTSVKRGAPGQTATVRRRQPPSKRRAAWRFPALAVCRWASVHVLRAVHVNEQLRGCSAGRDRRLGRPGARRLHRTRIDVTRRSPGAAQECAAPKTRIALQTFDIKVYSSLMAGC